MDAGCSRDAPANKRGKYQAALSLQLRKACVAEAVSMYGIEVGSRGEWLLSNSSEDNLPDHAIRFSSIAQYKRLSAIREWSRQQYDQDWEGYCNHPSVVKQYGSVEKAWNGCKRLPTWWLDRCFRHRAPETTTEYNIPKARKLRHVDSDPSISIELFQAGNGEHKVSQSPPPAPSATGTDTPRADGSVEQIRTANISAPPSCPEVLGSDIAASVGESRAAGSCSEHARCESGDCGVTGTAASPSIEPVSSNAGVASGNVPSSWPEPLGLAPALAETPRSTTGIENGLSEVDSGAIFGAMAQIADSSTPAAADTLVIKTVTASAGVETGQKRVATFPLSIGTKKSLLQKYPALQKVLTEFNKEHEIEREEDNDVSFNDLWVTFQNILSRHRSLQSEIGNPNALPPKVSVGWFCAAKKKLGVRNSAVQSTEIRRAAPDKLLEYLSRIARARAARSIPANGIIVFDETNCFMLRAAKRVQSAPSEATKKTGRRVRRKTNSRLTYTAGVAYTVASKSKVLLLLDRCTKAVAKRITEDFGDYVELLARRGKVLNGSTHAHCVLPNLIVPFAQAARARQGHSGDTPYMFLEDSASVHFGNSCRQTKETGLQAIREGHLVGANVIRDFVPPDGTADVAPPDQVFKIIKLVQHDALRELVGLGPDLSRRPRGPVPAKYGGPLKTDAGNVRGPTPYLIAGSWAKAWAKVPQQTLAASFVRAGLLSKPEVIDALRCTPGALHAGIQDLAAWQRIVRKSNTWLHPEQDFSGSRRLPHGDMPEPSAEDRLVIAANVAEVRRLDRLLRPNALSTIGSVEASPEANAACLAYFKTQLHPHTLVQQGIATDGNSMANLSALPSQANVNEWQFFEKAWAVILKSVSTWQRKAEAYRSDVLQFHFLALQTRYYTLIDSDDNRVVRIVNGRRSLKTMASWFWDIIRQAHLLNTPGKEELARNLIGDFVKLSLNPAGIHRKQAIPKAYPVAAPKISGGSASMPKSSTPTATKACTSAVPKLTSAVPCCMVASKSGSAAIPKAVAHAVAKMGAVAIPKTGAQSSAKGAS